MAASAPRGGEDFLPGGRVTLTLTLTLSAASAFPAAVLLGGDFADYGLGRGVALLAAAAGGDEGKSAEDEEKRDDAGHRERSISAATAA